MSNQSRRRLAMLWYYPIVIAIIALFVGGYVLLYNGDGALSLRDTSVVPEASNGVITEPPEDNLDDVTDAQSDDNDVPNEVADNTGRLFPYEENGLFGYMNSNAEIVIEAAYTDAFEFADRYYAFVETEEGYGLLGRDGVFLVEPTYSYVRDFVNGYAAVELDDKWGYIDESGIRTVQSVYREAGDFHNGRARVRTGDTWGYIDVDGDMAISDIWDDCGDFGDDMAWVIEDGDAYLIDRMGEKLQSLDSVEGFGYSEGFSPIKEDDGYRYYNTSRRYAFSELYENAMPFSGGLAAVKSDGKWGYIDTDGALVIPATFEEANSFHDNRAAVKDESGLWGYIDKTGDIIVPHSYDAAGDYVDGYAIVEKGSNVGIVDKSGNFTLLYTK